MRYSIEHLPKEQQHNVHHYRRELIYAAEALHASMRLYKRLLVDAATCNTIDAKDVKSHLKIIAQYRRSVKTQVINLVNAVQYTTKSAQIL